MIYKLKTLLILIFFQGFTTLVYSQKIDCDSLAQDFYKIDSVSNTILTYFCEGVEEAINYKKLSIRSTGQANFLNSCTFYAYEKYGVNLELTGDIVVNGQEIKNDGFNAIMTPRIKKALGNNYSKLGIVDTSLIVLSELEFTSELALIFNHHSAETDSTLILQLDSKALEQSVFQNFEGVMFETITKDTLSVDDLKRGSLIPKYKTRTYLKIDFTNYTNPNHICLPSTKWVMVYPFKAK